MCLVKESPLRSCNSLKHSGMSISKHTDIHRCTNTRKLVIIFLHIRQELGDSGFNDLFFFKSNMDSHSYSKDENTCFKSTNQSVIGI